MRPPRFTGSFTQQLPLPEDAIAAAEAVMRSGRLHRYNVAPGEVSEAARLEEAFARWQGARYCLALASGGQAMQIALRAAGVKPGDRVLTNAFTLAPVPGAIASVGAVPVLVETTDDLVIDLDDLAAKARQSGAGVLLLSHMRGHICDMERLAALARDCGLRVIEDCAHTMGARWNGRRSGAFGLAACFSTQTYKHLNSGEGGLLTSDDADLMARAVLLSGSYMLYERHGAAPSAEVFAEVRLDTPNMSARMDNLRAALLRPQLARIEDSLTGWNARHDHLASRLGAHPAVRMPARPPQESYVGSSIQFRAPALSAGGCTALLAAAAERGVELKWFGAAEPVGFTSAHQSWRYIARHDLPQTERVLATLFDMRIPLTFTLDDCDLIATHILGALDETLAEDVR
ncbi:DegT/DnrJ/EryC1/StrS family aminotransferase [Ancylobacter pratisalsi]|uniref:Aminotransferase class I/II-fold pyridoxal phosphate-dependent enzyme n=1 Tax=Ancylobacter pratisalsi TaxID=1745854 RepID=A0A6P1YWD3_9HYPH|nr:aminotransferase class I/II-fold pyridoxal phosphate-dependent enzyme [Ancylobacter pratisalsi]QIB36433.1 aminotransferase class I/II-fold pyridoxal phosphate-dependent enzyme [Ancylobacter pratisalsi]